MPQPLDFRWVDQIHTRLAIRFGARWSNLWVGIPPEAVKADWSQCLAGVTGEQIGYALEHLPDEQPPTVAAFKRLCLNAPNLAQALPPPKASREEAEKANRALQAVADGLKAQTRRDPRQWACELQAREARGERLSIVQRRFWREALATVEKPAITEMRPVPPEVLPPGMRPARAFADEEFA